MRQPKTEFQGFLQFFPEVELPITLNDEIHHIFSQQNKPLNHRFIDEFILPYEGEVGELTEFVPCFKVSDTHEFHAIVYWKAALMNYNYVLVTYSKTGALLDRRVIAGTYSDGARLTKSIATIDEDWMILIVTGQNDHNSSEYNAASSKTHQLELLPDGMIADFSQSAN